jgi:hypothetical protein
VFTRVESVGREGHSRVHTRHNLRQQRARETSRHPLSQVQTYYSPGIMTIPDHRPKSDPNIKACRDLEGLREDPRHSRLVLDELRLVTFKVNPDLAEAIAFRCHPIKTCMACKHPSGQDCDADPRMYGCETKATGSRNCYLVGGNVSMVFATQNTSVLDQITFRDGSGMRIKSLDKDPAVFPSPPSAQGRRVSCQITSSHRNARAPSRHVDLSVIRAITGQQCRV